MSPICKRPFDLSTRGVFGRRRPAKALEFGRVDPDRVVQSQNTILEREDGLGRPRTEKSL
jgi:hypothetical protein